MTKTALRFLVLMLFGLSTANHATSQSSADDQNEEKAARQEVLKTDEAFNNAVMARDADALAPLLADKLAWIARGDRLDKRQVIADIRSQNLHFKSLTHDQILVSMFGNTAVVTGHSTSVLEYKGQLFSTPRLFTTVYMKLNGQWQMVAHQVSDVVEKH
jgi:ketosteroid isomerase-like protein